MSLQPTIAVTGASGHLGNVICRLLLQKGYMVKGLFHRFKQSIEDLPIETVQGDILNKADLRRLIAGCEVVINCAAIVSIHGDPTGIVFRTNTEGPKNVLEVATELNVKKIVHISSTHAVHELPHTIAYNELRPYKTASDFTYDYSKAQGEQLMLTSNMNKGPEIVIVRPSLIIGPYDFKPSEMGKGLIDLYHQKIHLLPQGGYNFVDVRDVASSIISAMEKASHADIFLLSGKYYTLREMVAIVQEITGKKMPKRIIGYRIMKTLLPLVSLHAKLIKAAPLYSMDSIVALRNGHPHMDNSKAVTTLNHAFRPLQESIRDFYVWHATTDKNNSTWI